MLIRKLLSLALLLIMTVFLLCACARMASDMKDGYYTAEADVYDAYGWKEYMTIYVRDSQIVTVEYDAFNKSGFVKSWDLDYMRAMKTTCGTYPNEYSRTYAVSLINWQKPDDVDALSGATDSHNSFQMLAEAAMERARAGDKSVALVKLH